MGLLNFVRWDRISAALVLSSVLLTSGCTGSSTSDEPAAGAVTGGSGTSAGGSAGGGSQSGSGGAAPTVSLSADSLTVNEGGSTNLSWTAPGADSCTASGGWSGSLSTSGSRTVGPLNAGTTFTLSCTGSGGSALQMISVAVVGPVAVSWIPPEENEDGTTLTDLAGYRIYYGQTSRSYSDMVEVGSPTATSYSLSLASGDYYVAMTAMDSTGAESGYSNEVLKTRL